MNTHGHLLHIRQACRVQHMIRVLRRRKLARIQLATFVVLVLFDRAASHGRITGVDEAVSHAYTQFSPLLFRLGLHLRQLKRVRHGFLVAPRLKV